LTKKIRLFVDAHVFDGIQQGTVTFLAGLYSELIKDSRFQLFVGSNEMSVAEKFLGSNKFVHIKYNTSSKIIRLLYTIPKALKENKIDFAHFQYISPILKPCNYIVTIHDLLFLEYPSHFPLSYRIKNSILFYLSGKRADLITTVSDYSKKSIHRFFKIPSDSIEIVPNAVIQQKVDPEPIQKLLDKKFILFVSRIEPRKNQALLIRIWKELGLYNQDIDLVLVGSDGLHDNKFKLQLQQLSETEHNHFYWLTKIPFKKLIWLYQNCTLFVFPSSAEGFGIPPLEAAIYGAKVLCSNTTAMKEFDFFEKFQFNPNNYEEFKQALLFAINNNFNHELAISAITSKYDWRKIAANFGNLICMRKHKNS